MSDMKNGDREPRGPEGQEGRRGRSLREASIGLGLSKWRTTLFVTLPAGRSGIVTGAMLAVARVMGETAPLLLTVLGSSFWFSGLDRPTAALPLTVYTYATSPFPDWKEKAWGAALVLLLIVLSLNVAVKYMTRSDRRIRS